MRKYVVIGALLLAALVLTSCGQKTTCVVRRSGWLGFLPIGRNRVEIGGSHPNDSQLTCTARGWMMQPERKEINEEPEPTEAPAPTNIDDPVLEALSCLGFDSREEFVSFFEMEVATREVATCPQEGCCIRVLREKDEGGSITPFEMSNPTNATFDGWRSAKHEEQAKVPPGTWSVEGITIRPWR